MKKTRLKIALSTMLVIFNLVFCFVATYAWFVGMKDNDASGLNFKMHGFDLDIEYYKVFRYSDDTKCGVDATDDPNGPLQLVLYDTVIKAKNEHTAVILMFCISGQEIGTSTLRASLYCNETHTTPYDEDETDEWLSNAVRFKFAPIPTSTIAPITDSVTHVPTAAESASIYQNAISFFESAGAEKTFSTWQNKSTAITQDFTSTSYASSMSGNKLYFYMLFDYSESLIDKLLTDSYPAKVTPGGRFIGDLTNLILSAVSEN